MCRDNTRAINVDDHLMTVGAIWKIVYLQDVKKHPQVILRTILSPNMLVAMAAIWPKFIFSTPRRSMVSIQSIFYPPQRRDMASAGHMAQRLKFFTVCDAVLYVKRDLH